MPDIQLNPLVRSPVVEALTEESRGPEGRQSFSQLIGVLERSTTQMFRRLPNILDRTSNYLSKTWKEVHGAINNKVGALRDDLVSSSWIRKPYFFVFLIGVLFGWLILTISFIFVILVHILMQLGVISLYSIIVLALMNLYDIVCYVQFKLFALGLSNTFRQMECFAKKNKFYYEEIRHLQWNWKSYGKILRHYHTIILLWLFVFIPIIVYESSSLASNSVKIHYDLNVLSDEYYEEVVTIVLSLLGFGDWYDFLFKKRDDLGIIMDPYIPTATVYNNDFVDNMSHLQVVDFLHKEGFVFLHTDDQRVKLLLHQFTTPKFSLLMKPKDECMESDHEAKKVYEMENYLKIQIREGKIVQGDHLVIVQEKSASTEEEGIDSDGSKYNVIVQSAFVWPTEVPTYQELYSLWMTKLWLTESQSRNFRTLIILFTIFYALNELFHCQWIPYHQTWIFVYLFLVLLFVLLFVQAVLNVFTTYDAFLYNEDDKDNLLIDIFNNQ